MKSKKIYLCSLIFVIGAAHLFAVSWQEDKDYPRLGSNYSDRQLNYVKESSEVVLLPDYADKPILEREFRAFNPSGLVELLYTMPLPETGGKDMMLYLLQSISRISTLEGIEYWSGSRKRMYTYLEEAYPVEKRRSYKRLDDPVFNSLPSGEQKLSVFQSDTTFGKTWYDVTYKVTGDAIRLSMVNTTTMRYKMFPVLRDHRLQVDMIIIPRENDLLFYGSAAFRLGNTFGIEIDLDESFDHRMSALQTWFANQAYK